MAPLGDDMIPLEGCYVIPLGGCYYFLEGCYDLLGGFVCVCAWGGVLRFSLGT